MSDVTGVTGRDDLISGFDVAFLILTGMERAASIHAVDDGFESFRQP